MEHVEKEGLAIYAGALALQLEGIVAKDSKARTWKAHEKHGTGKKLRTRITSGGESRGSGKNQFFRKCALEGTKPMSGGGSSPVHAASVPSNVISPTRANRFMTVCTDARRLR